MNHAAVSGTSHRPTRRWTGFLACLLTGLLSVNPVMASPASSTPQAATAAVDDSLLKATWVRFANAVVSGDTQAFRALSAPCIHCMWCMSRFGPADTTPAWIRAFSERMLSDTLPDENRGLISVDQFIRGEFQGIFTPNLHGRMRDSAMLIFADNQHSAELYEHRCITGENRKAAHACREVLLTVTDPTSTYEGRQYAFAFILLGGQYKFCGFSTIP